MKRGYDIIIIGIGAMGSATAFHLAQKGKKVLGIDRYTPPHAFGSSHGQSRIIREAYFEDPQYVPIVQQAYKNWEKLEKDSGQSLYLQTGGLMMGSADSEIVKGAMRSAKLHQLDHELLDARTLKKRFPAFHTSPDTMAVLEPRAGIIFPEESIRAHIKVAGREGGDFLFDEPAVSWERSGHGICVVTSAGKYYADQLLLTAGAWLNDFLPAHSLPLTIERQVLYWFDPIAQTVNFGPNHFPVFIWTTETGNDFYGFPDLGQGAKFARSHSGELTDPDGVDREVTEAEIEMIRSFLKNYIPSANGKLRETAVCMYTNTPNHHFLINRHSDHEQVLIASICSGHGFKFSSAMGEILADILLEKRSSFDLSLFGFH